MKFAVIVLAILAGFGAFMAMRRTPPEPERSTSTSSAIRYLPLGDSYTIGQSVKEDERWPNQLAARLSAQGIELDIVANPSRTGYTTQDLIDVELPVLKRTKPEFVTILIGVNDWVQGVDADTFRKNLVFILDDVQGSLPDRSKVLLVTIPDFGKTPSGSSFGRPEEIAKGIAQFNTIIIGEAKARNLPVADIYTVSQDALRDPSLVANDGLHPSGKQYGKWTEIILPAAETLLKR